jgi:hypothetical protein
VAVDSFRIRRPGTADPVGTRRRWQSAVGLAVCAGAFTLLVAACGDANPNYRNDYTDTTPGPVPAASVTMTAQPNTPETLPPAIETPAVTVVPTTSVAPLTSAPVATGSPVG